MSYLGYFWPAAESGLVRTAVITSLVLILTLLNLIGVKESARASDVFTVSKLIPLLLFVVAGLFFIDPTRFTFPSTPGFGTFTSAVFVLLYVFSGFEAVLVNSGEVRQPQRVIPFALIVALSASVVLFLLIQIVCIGVLPNLGSSARPLADASQIFLGSAGPAIISYPTTINEPLAVESGLEPGCRGPLNPVATTGRPRGVELGANVGQSPKTWHWQWRRGPSDCC